MMCVVYHCSEYSAEHDVHVLLLYTGTTVCSTLQCERFWSFTILFPTYHLLRVAVLLYLSSSIYTCVLRDDDLLKAELD